MSSWRGRRRSGSELEGIIDWAFLHCGVGVVMLTSHDWIYLGDASRLQ